MKNEIMAVKRQSERACRKRLHLARVRIHGGVRWCHQWGKWGVGGEGMDTDTV